MNDGPQLSTTLIRVSNLERSVAWYKEILEMQVLIRLDERIRATTLTHDGKTKVTLTEASSPDEIVPTGLDTSYLVFATECLDADHALLKSRGATVSPIQDDSGLRLFWVTDPDGNQSVVMDFTAPPQ